MEQTQLKKLIYSALLLALAAGVQNLRLLMPLPPFASMFLIGSLINMLLLLNAKLAGIAYAAAASFILAGAAFLQGQLPIVFMVPIVAVGNALLAAAGSYFWHSRLVWAAPLLKAAYLWAATKLLLSWLELPEDASSILLVMMSWPQLITGLCGVALARFVGARLKFGRVL